MSDNNQNRSSTSEKVATPLDDRKMKLTTQNAEGRNASLAVAIFRDKFKRLNPRLTVYTNLQNERESINAKFDMRGFQAFLALLQMAIDFKPTADQPEFRKQAVTLRPNFKPGGGRPDGQVTDCEVFVGQDKAGCVWISLVQYQRTALKFVITHDEYLKFRHSSGDDFSAGDASKLASIGWLKIVSDVISKINIEQYQPEPPRENQGGGGGYSGGNRGGYQSNGGGGGNYDRRGGSGSSSGGGSGGGNSHQESLEEDQLPF